MALQQLQAQKAQDVCVNDTSIHVSNDEIFEGALHKMVTSLNATRHQMVTSLPVFPQNSKCFMMLSLCVWEFL